MDRQGASGGLDARRRPRAEDGVLQSIPPDVGSAPLKCPKWVHNAATVISQPMIGSSSAWTDRLASLPVHEVIRHPTRSLATRARPATRRRFGDTITSAP